MKLCDLLLRILVVLLFIAVGLMFGQLIPHMDAADLEPIEVEVVQGPESFVTFDAWMQHLNRVNRYVDLNKAVVTKRPVALMDPYFAKKYLRGDAWAAWAIQYNERARNAARGATTTRINSGHGESVTITTATRPTYTARPLTIYNPYCPPRE
ncbi:MAG: hypothetical protein ACYTFQ_17900 [Planctomycetota bacterium]|jgi:hypothetical protein